MPESVSSNIIPVDEPKFFPEDLIYQEEINKRLKNLLESHADIQKIAKILVAENFLEVIKKKGIPPVYRLNVQAFIENQIEKKTFLNLPQTFQEINEMIIPPDPGEIKVGDKEAMGKKDIIPRSRYLAEVLSEMNLGYQIIEGVNKPNVLRKLSYYIFIIPKINKMVLVNNEGGNATFVIHQFNSEQEDWHVYSNMSKNELKSFHDKPVSLLIYPGDKDKWKKSLRWFLENTPIFKKVNKDNCEKAPEGWMTNGGLSQKLKNTWQLISNIAGRYRQENPKWFRNYLNKTGRETEHYSPELVEIIKKEIDQREKAPEGWMTNGGLSQELKESETLIRNTASKYHQGHPEWFKLYLDKIGIKREHYSPELVEIIKKEIDQREKSPEEWITNKSLAQKFKRSEDLIKNIAEKYHQKNPEWFEIYLDKTGREREHYSPELAEIIKKEIDQREKAPEGWMTNGGLSQELEKSWYLIKNIAEKYHQGHPEWFKLYLDKIGKKTEHYSPELVKEIKEELKNR